MGGTILAEKPDERGKDPVSSTPPKRITSELQPANAIAVLKRMILRPLLKPVVTATRPFFALLMIQTHYKITQHLQVDLIIHSVKMGLNNSVNKGFIFAKYR